MVYKVLQSREIYIYTVYHRIQPGYKTVCSVFSSCDVLCVAFTYSCNGVKVAIDGGGGVRSSGVVDVVDGVVGVVELELEKLEGGDSDWAERVRLNGSEASPLAQLLGSP